MGALKYLILGCFSIWLVIHLSFCLINYKMIKQLYIYIYIYIYIPKIKIEDTNKKLIIPSSSH